MGPLPLTYAGNSDLFPYFIILVPEPPGPINRRRLVTRDRRLWGRECYFMRLARMLRPSSNSIPLLAVPNNRQMFCSGAAAKSVYFCSASSQLNKAKSQGTAELTRHTRLRHTECICFGAQTGRKTNTNRPLSKFLLVMLTLLLMGARERPY